MACWTDLSKPRVEHSSDGLKSRKRKERHIEAQMYVPELSLSTKLATRFIGESRATRSGNFKLIARLFQARRPAKNSLCEKVVLNFFKG
jgi:hypothetical protein